MPEKLTLCERGACSFWPFDTMTDDNSRVMIEMCKEQFELQRLSTEVNISRDVCPFERSPSTALRSIVGQMGEQDAS